MPSVANLFLHGHNSPTGSVARPEFLGNSSVSQMDAGKVVIRAGLHIDRRNAVAPIASDPDQIMSGPTGVLRFVQDQLCRFAPFGCLAANHRDRVSVQS